jgi:valyl-tRNA synthetase
MLGDTGVAVHPEDERYVNLVRKKVRLPLVDRIIPIVADPAVDPEFGTGAVKVTPAHDPTDYEIAERTGLDSIVVIDTDGAITKAGGRFAGLDRYEAREAVRHQLAKEGFIVEIEDHHHSVGHCSRCGTVVEPLLSTQWFVKVGPMVGPAIDAVRNGDSRFVPQRWEKNYFHWMENLRDWCISRQLWWGHRIPAWYCDGCDDIIVSRDDVTECPTCGGSVRADDDVLDTWFSSALWPFSTLGWPDETDDLARFYPTSALVTGFDIIYFWVARMMQMGMHFMGQKPFSDIVIHGLLRSADGRKMSKSAGNALDPLELVDRYGADAVRLTLIQSAAPGHDIPLNEEWVDASRRFGNKLWNALRFVVEHNDITGVPEARAYPDAPGPEDAWILARLSEVVAAYDQLFDEYRFSDAVGLLYNFAWSEVFDWYLEMAKLGLRDEARAPATRQTLGVVMRDLLKLFHPVIPYVTEELWSELGDGSLLATASWPSPPTPTPPAGMAELQDLISGLRRFRTEHQLGRRSFGILLDDPDGIAGAWWNPQLVALAGAEVTATTAPAELAGHTRIHAGTVSAFIPLAGVVDVDAERPRLEKAIADAQDQLAKTEAKLANPNFRDRAPAEVVAKEEAKRGELTAAVDKLSTQLAELG